MALQASTASATTAWTQDYEVARKQARATDKPILALFTGSDWCPPCKQFEKDVAYSTRFLDYVGDKVVLLKLDFPQHMLQSPALIAQNVALAERIGGMEYPRFYLLDANGEVLVKLKTRVERQASDYCDYILQAIGEGLAEIEKTRR